MARKLEVEIVGDSRSLERAFGRASGSGSKLGRSLKTLGKGAAVGVGVAFAGMAATLKVGFDEMAEGQKVSAQTGAVLKSTGGIANVTAKDVEKLAESQSHLTGIDDELIQSGENLLLTFKNVRNEVGAGNDVFDRATKSALDLSVAGFGSVESASKMMGKALNDPIKGMTALGRAGVTFSEEQKKTIKGLVETGHALEAQKLILGEVESQVGGSAKAFGETFPGQISKLKNSFEEMAGSIVETLLPYLIQLVAWVNKNMPTIQRVIETTLNAVVATIRFIGPIISTLIGWFQKARDATEQYWPRIRAIIESVINWFRVNIVPTVQSVLNTVMRLWDKFGADIMRVVTAVFKVVLTIIGTALRNIKAIVEGVMALLRGDWSAAWEALKTIVRNTLSGIASVIGQVLRGVVPAAIAAARAIGVGIIQGIVAGLSGLFGAVKDAITSQVRGAIDGAKSFLGIGSPSKVTQQEIGVPMAEGVLAGWIEGSKELPQAMTDKTKAAIEAARSAIESSKGIFRQAFDTLISEAMSAFDKLASEIETRSEKRLRQLEERRAAAERKASIQEARGGLREADVALAGLTPEEGEDPAAFAARQEEARARVMAAQKALEDALFEQQKFELQRKAEQERKALEDRQALRRRHFEEDLQSLKAFAEKNHLTAQQLNERLLKLFAKYRIPFKNAAIGLGSALAEGLQEAAVEVGRQARAVRDEIMRYLGNIQIRINVDVVTPDKPDRRAGGGPVARGVPYVVGEKGPELFVPARSGYVLPNQTSSPALASGGGATVVLNFYGPTVGTGREFENTVRRALYDVGRRNPGTGF